MRYTKIKNIPNEKLKRGYELHDTCFYYVFLQIDDFNNICCEIFVPSFSNDPIANLYDISLNTSIKLLKEKAKNMIFTIAIDLLESILYYDNKNLKKSQISKLDDINLLLNISK